MKKILYLIPLSLLLAGGLFLYTPQKSELKHTEEDVISGAYEALNFMGARQGQIPSNAYYAAWESIRTLPELSTLFRDDPDPWETMGPHNKGGRTLALALNPQNTNTIYAGSASGGLWRSTTAAEGIDAWEYVETGFPVLAVSSIAIHPQDSMKMFIGTGEVYNYFEAGTGAAYRSTRGSFGMGILSSNDGGETWEKSLDWSYNQQRGIWAIKFAPSNPDIMYAATTEGVYKSTDGGETWAQVHDVIMANDLLVHPDDPDLVIVGCGNFSTTGKGIYKTTNGGDSWSPITNNVPSTFNGKIQLGLAPSNPDIVYASIGNGFSSADGATWLLRSEDFGSSWELRSTVDYSRWQGWFSHDVAVSPNNPNIITAIGINVWNSLNGGLNLNVNTVGGIGYDNPPIEGPYGAPNFVHSDAHDVIYHPTDPNILYIASDGGISKSINGGQTFSTCNARYQTVQFYNGFSVSNQNADFAVGGLQDNGTILWNGDLTWRGILGGDGSWTGVNPDNDDIFFASSQYLNMARTTNGGDNFSGINPLTVGPTVFIAPFIVSPSNGNIVYAASAGVSKTFNGFNNWQLTNNGQPLSATSNPILSMDVSSQTTTVVYAATAPQSGAESEVFVTQDGGVTWQNVTSEVLPGQRYPMDISVDPTDDATAYITYSGFGTGHVFRTTDFGQTWTDITGDLPDVPTNAVIVDPLFPNNVYVGNDLGVFVSIDYGETWATYQDGFPTAIMIFDMKISPVDRKLRIASHGNGAYQRDLVEEPIVNTNDLVNLNMNLSVFPNPVKDRATLSFELEKTQDLIIQILDGNGRMVRQIADWQFNSGEHNLEFNLEPLPKGAYYLRLMSNNNQQMTKIMLQ